MMNNNDSLKLEIYDSVMEGAISSDEANELVSILEASEDSENKEKSDDDKKAKRKAIAKKVAIGAAAVGGAAGAGYLIDRHLKKKAAKETAEIRRALQKNDAISKIADDRVNRAVEANTQKYKDALKKKAEETAAKKKELTNAEIRRASEEVGKKMREEAEQAKAAAREKEIIANKLKADMKRRASELAGEDLANAEKMKDVRKLEKRAINKATMRKKIASLREEFNKKQAERRTPSKKALELLDKLEDIYNDQYSGQYGD